MESLYTFLYKIGCLITGMLIIFLGYRLYVKGIFNEAGGFEGQWKDLKLIIRKAVPGTYFVIFGSLVIGLTVYRGMDFKYQAGSASAIPMADSSLLNIDTNTLFHDRPDSNKINKKP